MLKCPLTGEAKIRSVLGGGVEGGCRIMPPLAAICCGLCGGKGRWRSGDELGGGGAFVRAQLLL
jgi:hypothetical protein